MHACITQGDGEMAKNEDEWKRAQERAHECMHACNLGVYRE